jgi:L-seryl-tRNA(Ser) seleniumtransferase
VVQFYIKAGVDAVTFSGDKLLGGPQCGIICGKPTIIKKIRNNALYRAIRCDKITYILLEETLRTYYNSTYIKPQNLTWTLFQRKLIELEKMGGQVISQLSESILKKSGIKLIASTVEAGSGSLPTQKINSFALNFNSNIFKPTELHRKFLNYNPSIVGYIHNNQYNIDLKAVLNIQFNIVKKAIMEIYS